MTPPGANTFLLRVKSLSKPRSKRYEPCLHTYQGRHIVHRSTLAYLSSYIYHLPRPESKNKSKSAQILTPPGANTLPLSNEMGQMPSIDSFKSRWVPIRLLRKARVVVFWRTYRVILITSRRQCLAYQFSPLLASPSPGRLKVTAGVLLTVLTAEDLRLSRFFNKSPGEGAPLSTSNATPPIPDG